MDRWLNYLLLALMGLILGCGASKNSSQEEEKLREEIPQEEYSLFDVNLYPPQKTVCHPFSSSSPVNESPEEPYFHRGIRAHLYTVAPGESYSRVQDYIDQGLRSEQVIFLSDLNVPTRKFDLGFVNPLGEPIRDDRGDVLVEQFALDMTTVFRLSEDQEPGRYEFAVLSDDGAVWEYRDDDGVYRELVNNGGNTPTRMGCSHVTMDLQRGKSIVMNLKYYQGPRYHISLVAMMRKLEEGESPGGDPSCGRSGNGLYFDDNQGSQPQPAYLDLLERGWKPLSPSHFELPLVFSYNPCQGGDSPEIYDVSEKVDRSGRYLTWKTSLKSTSQLIYTHPETGKTEITVSDNILRMEHKVMISGAEEGVVQKLSLKSVPHQLMVQPYSVSHSLGRSRGAPHPIQF